MSTTRLRVFVWLLLTLFLATGCGLEADEAVRDLTPGQGTIAVPGGKVWYEIVGSGRATPLLLLHGGPGATSYAFEPLKQLADERPVVFYDQLGCGRSERPSDVSLWTIERFVEELRQVRETLGLDEVHILGHSWGSMLAVEYMLSQPDGVQSLVLAGPVLSVPRFLSDATRLRGKLPPEIREILLRHERAGTTDSEEYQDAALEFYKRHLCRLDPMPPEMEKSMEEFGWEVYHTMWGPSEFYATGSLKSFDRLDRLGEIRVPVLYTAGRHDEVIPETVAMYRMRTPGSKMRIFLDASHMTMLEKPNEYAEAIREFLREVEQGDQAGEGNADKP